MNALILGHPGDLPAAQAPRARISLRAAGDDALDDLGCELDDDDGGGRNAGIGFARPAGPDFDIGGRRLRSAALDDPQPLILLPHRGKT